MKGLSIATFLDSAGRLLDLGGTRVMHGARDPNEAAMRALRSAWADVAGELRAVVEEERSAIGEGVDTPDLRVVTKPFSMRGSIRE